MGEWRYSSTYSQTGFQTKVRYKLHAPVAFHGKITSSNIWIWDWACHKGIWRFRGQFLVSADSRIPIPPSACTISTECSWHLDGSSLIAKYRVIILSDTVTSHFPSARLNYSLHTGSSPTLYVTEACGSCSVKCNHYKLLSDCRKTYAFCRKSGQQLTNLYVI